MAATSTLGSLLLAYARDLREVLDTAIERVEDDTIHEGLLAKLCLEAARLAAYEARALVPVLRDVPHGGDLVTTESRRLDTLLDAARELEQTPLDGPVRDRLTQLLAATDDLARHQAEHTMPLVESAVPAEELEVVADDLTPTAQPGPTHSHPVALERFAAVGWPRPGYTDAAYDAFLAES